MPPSEVEVRALVRRTLSRLVEGAPQAPASAPGASSAALPTPATATVASRLIDETVIKALSAGATLTVPRGTLVTPLARQAALDRRVTLQDEGTPAPRVSKAPVQQRIAIGADHGGYPLKEALKPHLQTLGYEVVDCGTHNTDAVDYPDLAYAVARLVADGKCAAGIVIDGAGIGSCMAANKVPGVRAALCYDHATAVNSREHNHANVLSLGAGLIGVNLARQIVTDWLATPFGPGRHAKRVEKIMAIERRYVGAKK